MPKTPCDGCIYWRLIQGGSLGRGVHACHYCLDTGVTRTSLGVLGRGCRPKKERRGRR